jgi:tetratricopeptide (TPR) repeat protein
VLTASYDLTQERGSTTDVARPTTDPGQKETKSPDFVQRGKVLIVRRQFQEAVKVCRLGLLAHPTYVEGRLVLGMALMALTRHDEVLSEMRVALELEPDNPMAYLLKGEALFHKHDFVQSRDVLLRAQELDPLNVKIRKLLDEIDEAHEYGPDDGGPRARTETKVYPAQRAQELGVQREPSEILGGLISDFSGSMQWGEAPPAPVADSPSSDPPVDDGGTMEMSVEEEMEDAFTTAPFLPPMHMQRPRSTVDWEEHTISEDPPDMVAEDQPTDSTEERSDPLAQRAAPLPPIEAVASGIIGEWDTSDIDLHPVRDSGIDRVPSAAGIDRVPRAAPLPPVRPNLGLIAARTDEDEVQEEPTVIPGPSAARSGEQRGLEEAPLLARPSVEVSSDEIVEDQDEQEDEEEDQETVVNADIPPPEALFGEALAGAEAALADMPEEEEELGTRELSSADRYEPVEEPLAPRQPSDPTKAFDVSGAPPPPFTAASLAPHASTTPPPERTPSPPHISEVRFVSGVEVEQEPAVAIDPALSDLSEISVEMIPDDVEMPPLPLDARDAASAEAVLPEMVEEESPEDLETRVNFDALPEEPPPRELPPTNRHDPGAGRFDLEGDGAPEARIPPAPPPRLEPRLMALPSMERQWDKPAADRDWGSEGDGWPQPAAPAEPWNQANPFAPRGYDEEFGAPPVAAEPSRRVYDPERDIGRAAPPTEMLAEEDEDELALEPADSSGPLDWQQDAPEPAGRTAALDRDEGKAYPYIDAGGGAQEPTSETSPGGPKGLRSGPIRRAFGEGVLDQAPGEDSGLFRQRAATQVPEARGRRRAPSRAPQEKTHTSFITLIMGEPGSRRFLFLLLGAAAVLVVAVGVGLLVRYLRLGEQIEAKRRQAATRLRAGNIHDYVAAAQSYADILARRSGDRPAQWAQARIQSAILFEFGDPYPQTQPVDGADESIDHIAADIYSNLAGGSLQRAETLLAKGKRHHPNEPLLLYLEGRVKLLEGSSVASEAALQAALKLEPKDVMILCRLGDALMAQGQTAQALDTYRQSLAINPDHIASLIGKARVLVSTRVFLNEAEGDLQDICEGRRRNLASNGQKGWAHLTLAQLSIQQGKSKQADKHIDQAKQSAPKYDAPFLDEKAGVLIELFQLGEAEKAVQESKKMMQGRLQPFYRMAQIHQRNGLPRAALAELDQAKELHVGAPKLLHAQILLELGEIARANKDVEEVIAIAPDMVDALIIKAKVQAAKKNTGEAERILKAQLAKTPKSSQLLTALGEIYLGMGRLREAREKLTEATTYDTHAFDAQLKLAQVNEAEGNYKEAHHQLEEVSKANLGNVLVLKELARLEFDMGNPAEAATNLQRAIERTPNDPQLRLLLAKVLTAQRQYSKAEKAIRDAESNQADKVALNLARGRLAARRGRLTEAIGLLDSVRGAQPSSVEAWELLVRAHLENNDDAAARNTARLMSSALSPSAPEPEIAMGRIELVAAKPQAAIEKLRRATQLLKSSLRAPVVRAEVLVLIGRAHQDLSQPQVAASQYTEAVGICGQCAEPHYHLGQVQDELGQVPNAIKSLSAAIIRDPSYSDAYRELGQIYEREGQTEQAIKHYEKYLALNPSSELSKSVRETIATLRNKH